MESFNLNSPFEKGTSTISVDRAGLWTATAECYVETKYLGRAFPPPINHPTYSFLRRVEYNAEEMDGSGVTTVTAKYEGSGSPSLPGGPANPQYGFDDENDQYEESGDAQTVESPLETHPRYFDNLTADEITVARELALNPPREEYIDEDSGQSYQRPVDVDVSDWPARQAELYHKLKSGQTAWLEVTPVYHVRFLGALNAVNLTSVGAVVSPKGSPPSLGGGRGWLLSGHRYVTRGDKTEHFLTYTASGAVGWDPDLY